MAKLVDMAGRVLGRLEVIERDGSGAIGEALWKCRCGCGNEVTISGSRLRREDIRSCGQCDAGDNPADSDDEQGYPPAFGDRNVIPSKRALGMPDSEECFRPGTPLEGLEFGEFNHLSGDDKHKLIHLMARLCERFYRRGAQHALTAYLPHGPHLLEWGHEDVGKALSPSGYDEGTAVDRFFRDALDIQHLGFLRRYAAGDREGEA